VAVIRQALAALAQPLDLSRAMSDDIRLAVTEACTNVVRHAYAADDGKGIMDVIVRQRADAIEIEVADAGGGARSPDVKGPGLGLPLIAALADTVEVERNPPAGNRLKMSFGRARRAGAVGTT
jgi:anti-sigma regulatory factor (Ser/Thr protein kinase)